MTILAINWRGTSFYVAKHLFGSKAWQTCLRAIDGARPEDLNKRYLERLLEHASRHVPHYANLGLRDRPLSEYPILTKKQLRMNPEAFTRSDLSKHPCSRVSSSGSTGETVEILMDTDAGAWREAVDIWYFRELLATPPSTYFRSSKTYIWHRHQPDRLSLANRLARSLVPIRWLDPYETFSEAKLLSFARAINRHRPTFLWAYTGVLYELARAAQRRGIRLHSPRLIIASGETLHPTMRTVIEDAFGCRIYDYYGSAESGRVAAECTAGNLHVFSFACHVEVLDSDGHPAAPGERGRVIVTPLHSYAMPLIRYDIQDIAVAGPRECPCGCRLPTLKRLVGRTVEFFISPKGAMVSGARIASLMRYCPWVLGYQILQEDTDRLTVFFSRVPGSDPSSTDIDRVNREIAGALGSDCHIEWEEVGEIPRTPNGKRPYARSLVWEDRQPMAFWEPESESTPPDPDASPPSTLAGS